MKHYEPARTYLVTRIERWAQTVQVEARTPEEALLRAENDEGIINDDPEFHSFTSRDYWNAEEVPNDDPYREVSE